MRASAALGVASALLLGACVSEYGHFRIRGSSKPVLVPSQIACETRPPGDYSLRVVVTYEDDGPLPLVQVHALNLDSKVTAGPYRTTSEGSYTLHLAPGTWEISLVLPGFIPLRTRVSLPPDSACHVTLYMSLYPI